ncbi:PD-(D/E)XK nuclease family protein [Streptomyces sp. CNQ085]|uniref:PD-(D/E)XK nuclease family protein n=1 Tax=Streptomyces sp. CNQ085 TaxID=2886944 RepID=UPI001F50AC1B|nr:PD-(D/E)XK nuclease family protein [Streptomyces sp. CNQ085]MCI0386201.1 PD-(D/E)XK nuclease family protein [Streptomyces sp. CNQ085]
MTTATGRAGTVVVPAARPGLHKHSNGRGHWYTLDDRKVPGVTTLIGDGIPKPALINWAAKSVAEYVADNRHAVTQLWDTMPRAQVVAALKGTPYAQRDEAGRRGTEIHRLAERLAHGDEVEVPDEIAPQVDAAVRWLDDWQPRVLISEAPVASRQWWYAGTLDLVVETPDGTRWIVDWKSGKSGIWGEAALQLAAYAHAEFYLADDAEHPMADLRITRGLGVHLRPDGTYAAHEVDISAETFTHFTRVAWLARINKDMKARLVSEPMPTPTWGDTA